MTGDHPYRNAPDKSFWSRAVASAFEPSTVSDRPPFQIDRNDRFMSAGSCFASNLRRYLEAGGFSYVLAEQLHPNFEELVENPHYEAFSARYGNIYTTRQMTQLLKRSMRRFKPAEAFWNEGGVAWVDPFRPGLDFPARSRAEFEALTAQHLDAVVEAVKQASVFVFTLGLTEAWVSAEDGAVFPACPGTVSGTFNPNRHMFRNFTVAEIITDLDEMISLVREITPGMKIILTVSPVPLVATATGSHVLLATIYSKSVLRVAAGVAAATHDRTSYFPAYELVLGPQAPHDSFASDRRSVSEPAVAEVMSAFFHTYTAAASPHELPVGAPGERLASIGAPMPLGFQSKSADLLAHVTAAIDAECEEEMADPRGERPLLDTAEAMRSSDAPSVDLRHEDHFFPAASPCCHDRLLKGSAGDARCRACGTSFPAAGGIVDLRVDQSYDTLLDTEAYDRDHGIGAASATITLGVYDRLLDARYCAGHAFEDVLEIGSGTGNLTYGLASSDRFHRVHCSDLSPVFLDLLRRRMDALELGADLSYYLFDANQLPFADASMSLVLGHSVLHHLSRFEQTLSEVYRVLAPGGTAIFGEPVLDTHVFVSLAARLILQIDRSRLAARPVLGQRQIAALEILADRAALKASHLRIHARETLSDIEDKFIVPVDYMRKIAEEVGFAEFYFSNPTDEPIDLAELVRGQILDELRRLEIDTNPLEHYSYVIDSLEMVYGEAMREHLTHLFGFFVLQR